MKARQMFADWPRGRSTSAPIPLWRALRDYGPAICAQGWRGSVDCALDELPYLINYHEDQREMVWREWERYRDPLIVPTKPEIVQFLEDSIAIAFLNLTR
jgi:hypothetical protein